MAWIIDPQTERAEDRVLEFVFLVAADVRRLKLTSEMHPIGLKSEPPHVGCYDY